MYIQINIYIHIYIHTYNNESNSQTPDLDDILYVNFFVRLSLVISFILLRQPLLMHSSMCVVALMHYHSSIYSYIYVHICIHIYVAKPYNKYIHIYIYIYVYIFMLQSPTTNSEKTALCDFFVRCFYVYLHLHLYIYIYMCFLDNLKSLDIL